MDINQTKELPDIGIAEESFEQATAVKFVGVTKIFGSIVANDDVTMDLRRGEILALLGENGSGKTTLMNMLGGIYYPDGGHIEVDGKEVSIRSPRDSFDLGIGMIHQHFKLIDVFSAIENIALCSPRGEKYNLKATEEKVKEICDKYGFKVDPKQKVYDMSVSEKQTLEIVKVLYRGANILILDEPTAVLTPQESDRLFDVIRNMRNDGKSIIIITHKLHEVLDVSDRVAILRKGKYIDTVETKFATELSLTEMMVGDKVELNIDRSEPKNVSECVKIENLTCLNKYGVKALDDVSFTINNGEILGIAGIAGSGQKELLEAVAGLQKVESGSILYTDKETGEEHQLVGKNPRQIRDLGVSLAFVPEDRLGMGLVGSMGMTGNMLLRSYDKGGHIFTETKQPRKLAEEVKEELGVLTPGIETPVRKLSGGNVQKVLVGREIANAPKVLMTAYAVRGLDINTSYIIYNLLEKEKREGVAVVYVGEDLDVLLALSDRILVLCGGQVSGIVDARTTTKQEVGALMTRFKVSHSQEKEADND
jgi:simple sugar transport system ATP-binding protein